MAEAVEASGRIDVLVNNAYQVTHQTLEEISDEEWDHTSRTKIYAMFHLAKAAIANFTARLAQLLGERGIRVSSVAPGPIWTPLTPSTMPPEKVASFGQGTPLQRPGQPRELAPVYVLLASEEGSYISGARGPSQAADRCSDPPGRRRPPRKRHHRGMTVALVRRPSPKLDQGIVTHLERRSVDLGRAQAQWDGYVAALAGAGWRTVEVAPAEDCPDGVFVEDTMVVYRGVAVIARSGADTRLPETPGAEASVAGFGYAVARIEPPGTLEGGDVLKVGDTVYVGRGGRTNGEGIRQLRRILGPLGASVVAVPVRSVLHLKSAITALPDGTVIGYPPIVDEPGLFPRFLAMPEEAGSHVVELGEGRVLMAAGAPRSAELVADLGYEPVVVDISEYEKLEGCVTCLSVRLRAVDR